MKRPLSFTVTGVHLVFFTSLILLGLVSEAHAVIYDLKSQWSETQNPNGVWSYMAGDSYLPGCSNWSDSYGTQFAWVAGTDWSGHVPAWFQAKTNYWWTSVGDIVCHTTAPYSTYQGSARAVWTSPVDSQIVIDGSVWLARPTNPPRSTYWYLDLNGSQVSSGYLYYDGNLYDDLLDGSGGASALSTYVHVGDTVALRLVRGGNGLEDYVGVNFTIETIPEPATVTIMLLGATLCVIKRKR